MRQISVDEAAAVGGAACGSLTFSISISGGSLSGSLDAWSSCLTSMGDTLSGYIDHWTTGIPYGEPHVA